MKDGQFAEPRFVLKRVLFFEDIDNPDPEKMNELISLNKKHVVVSYDGKIYIEETVLFSLLRKSSISEKLKYKKEISKQDAERLLSLAEDEPSFVHEVYNLLNNGKYQLVTD